MPTQILTRHTNKRIQLENSSIARQFNLPAWTRLRVGVHASLVGPTIVGGFPHWTIGLCSGVANIYPNNCHFAGFQTNNSTMWTMQTTYVSGFGGTGATTRYRLVKKVGAVESYGADSNNTAGQNFGGGSTFANNNGLIGLEYEKTSGTTWTLRPFCWTASTTGNNFSDAFCLQAMEVPYGSFNTVSEHNYVRTAETMTVDEGTDGVLDAVNIAWNRSGQYVEILNVFVTRLS